MVLADVQTGVAALGAVDADLPVRRPAIDHVGVGIAEQQIAAVAHPDRPFDELESAGQLLDLGIPLDELIKCRVLPKNLAGHRPRDPRLLGSVEVERRRADPDEVDRRIGDRRVHAEDGELELLARDGRPG